MMLLEVVALLAAVETAAVPGCSVAGHVTASNLPLPGVALTVSDGTTDVAISSTDLDGAYRIALPAAGKYSMTTALAGFAGTSQEIELTAEACTKQLDFTLGLKSRAAAAPTSSPSPSASSTATTAAAPAPRPTPATTAAQPPRAGGTAGRFQEVTVAAAGPQPAASAEGAAAAAATGADAAAMSVPQGFSTEAPTDSVTTTGAQIDVADNVMRDRMDMMESMNGDLDMMARRMSMGMDPSGMSSMMMSGPGGGMMMMGGGGMTFFNSMGGGGGRERLQGSITHTFGGSALDAAPYVLNNGANATGSPTATLPVGGTPKADYTQHRVNMNLSGPLKIPGIYDGTGRTRFNIGFGSSWDRRPYDSYSTVPTEAERAGDLSGRGRIIYDPVTGAPFPGGVIPESRFDPAARTLLEFIPLPNLPGDVQNFHYVTANRSNNTSFNVSFNHRFGPATGATRQRRPGAQTAAARPTPAPAAAGADKAATTSSDKPAEKPSGDTPAADKPAADKPADKPTETTSTATATASSASERERGNRGARGAGAGGGGGRGVGAGGGGAASRRGSTPMGRRMPMLNASFNYSHGSNVSVGRFPTLGGEGDNTFMFGNAGLSFGLGRTSHNTRLSYNSSRFDGLNLYAFNRNVAGEAGIGGVSDDPFDWGVPNVSFTTFQDLYDRPPSKRVDSRWSINHSVSFTLKKHSIRAGGEFRHQSSESQTDSNARGAFTFTGLYTSRPGGGAARDGGLDFADFLLGLPQQTSLAYGPGKLGFSTQSWNLYFTDDWRINGALTLTAGLRYEFVSPLEEADGRLVNLDVPADFSGAAPVFAGKVGPFTGQFPDSLVHADRNNVAPRLGIAWTPNRQSSRRMTVRAGYGVSYNLNAYQRIAERMSAQPPFAVTNTSQGTPGAPLTFESPFVVANADTVTNSYGIDKNYELAAVEIWNLDVSKELPHGWNVGGGYTGTAGRNLDITRAPNRDRNGLRIANVQAFTWQSSEGTSSTHSMSVRLRKRMGRGFNAGLNYTFGKSLDNASSIGGGGMVVAQDDRNLAAEKGRSSFDRRHRLSMNYNWQLPFGTGRRWLTKGFGNAVAGGWSWSGNAMVQSGGPFTARIVGDFADVGRGVNGTLRANYTGAPVQLDNPSIQRWFNTEAFVLPPSGQFGDAGRNTITGPGSFLVNMNLERNISLGRPRTMSVRVQANNIFNVANYQSINTTVNSPLFGQVTSVGQMRSVQITTSVRF